MPHMFVHDQSLILTIKHSVDYKATSSHYLNTCSKLWFLNVSEVDLGVVYDLLKLLKPDLEASFCHERINVIDAVLADPEDAFHSPAFRLISHEALNSNTYD